MLDSSKPLDLFDFRYGKNGAVLYREGTTSPDQASSLSIDEDGCNQEKLGMQSIETEASLFDTLKSDDSPLKKIAGKSIRQLAKEPGLLVFPENIKDGPWEEIQKNCIFDLEKIGDYLRISTYNLIGFIGCGDLNINIHSRFEEWKISCNGRYYNDYFLIYMLKKIAKLSLLDLPTPSRDDISVFDLLPYLFPKYLKNALGQGMYKEYVLRKHNDANIKGAIDVGRHIRSNVPFIGKVAYNTREFSFDNSITQLIRHTIEHLKNSSDETEKILSSSDVHEMVMQIVKATPTYSKSDREKVIMDNLKPFSHPYYSEYGPLQKLCLAILRYDKLSYGDSDNEVHGVIFDIAALWEEYLAAVFEEGNCNIVHPNNRTGDNPQFLFASRKYSRYPDFHKMDKSIVMDAKYKRIADHNNLIDRDDIHQLIAYMYIMQSKAGMIISPAANSDYTHWHDLGTLNGFGGNVTIYYMRIPDQDDYEAFCKEMKNEEYLLLSRLNWDV